MSEFDHKAREWDQNTQYHERAAAVAASLLEMVPLRPGLKALEFGAGTGLLSFTLAGHFREIVMMDSSSEMVKVMEEKVTQRQMHHLIPCFGELTEESFPPESFDVIYNLMVMHHVEDIPAILRRFHGLLRPGGWLVLADLYAEDGTFHSKGFHGHKGFDPQELRREVEAAGLLFKEVRPCYTSRKEKEGVVREYPVFMMTALKPEAEDSQRREALTTFARRLVSGESGKPLYEEYRPYIETVTPFEAMMLLDSLLKEGHSFGTVKYYTARLLNLFYKPLAAWPCQLPGEGHFLYYLAQENREAEKIMAAIKKVAKQYLSQENTSPEALINLELLTLLSRLDDYTIHYVKKENILFPWLEKVHPEAGCLQIMWSLHDDFRRTLRALKKMLREGTPGREQLSPLLGNLFFVVLPVIFREEHILFPVALSAVPRKAWDDILEESMETGWCYGVMPVLPWQEESAAAGKESAGAGTLSGGGSGLIDMGTGLLTPEQLALMLNHMPIDVTLVNEHDVVLYFSGGPHRIFP
ncbi:MAG TPA: methyltransferase domain-containing protein, partial [Prolixibacteraceae bacterium]|nr:methyltransferase domain-containing protein [Prolixibacteraceae bacterium]